MQVVKIMHHYLAAVINKCGQIRLSAEAKYLYGCYSGETTSQTISCINSSPMNSWMVTLPGPIADKGKLLAGAFYQPVSPFFHDNAMFNESISLFS